MKFETIKTLKTEAFRRLTDVKRETFDNMAFILQESLRLKKIKSGRPGKLSIHDMFLMTLEYLREYRTYFHIAKSYVKNREFLILMTQINNYANLFHCFHDYQ